MAQGRPVTSEIAKAPRSKTFSCAISSTHSPAPRSWKTRSLDEERSLARASVDHGRVPRSRFRRDRAGLRRTSKRPSSGAVKVHPTLALSPGSSVTPGGTATAVASRRHRSAATGRRPRFLTSTERETSSPARALRDRAARSHARTRPARPGDSRAPGVGSGSGAQSTKFTFVSTPSARAPGSAPTKRPPPASPRIAPAPRGRRTPRGPALPRLASSRTASGPFWIAARNGTRSAPFGGAMAPDFQRRAWSIHPGGSRPRLPYRHSSRPGRGGAMPAFLQILYEPRCPDEGSSSWSSGIGFHRRCPWTGSRWKPGTAPAGCMDHALRWKSRSHRAAERSAPRSIARRDPERSGRGAADARRGSAGPRGVRRPLGAGAIRGLAGGDASSGRAWRAGGTAWTRT